MTVTISGTMPLGLDLLNIFESSGIRKTDLTVKADVSRSFVDRLFRGKESRFDLVLSIIRVLGADENKMIRQYCEEIEQAYNFIYAMEYADRRNDMALLERLFDRSGSKNHADLGEMREIYTLSLRRKKDGSTKNLEEVLFKLKCLEPVSPLAKSLQKFMEIQVHHSLHHFNQVNEKLKRINVSKIEDEFFYNSFKWRLNQVKQSISLDYFGNLIESRELAFELIKNSDSKYFHAYSYGNIGLSYSYENDDKAISYLNESQKLYKEVGIENDIWNETIEFIRIMWGQPIELEKIKSVQNLAFKLIKCGKYSHALQIIDKLDSEEGKSPLRLYLRGLATQEADYHWQSLEMYIKVRGDRLFAILPRNELIHLKENRIGVDALYNLNVSR
ncbi:AimR family lysis-lysogeny pheromone receptor [Rossellomorea marisflavi]|uniref:AimR family lysis-lysogeny pheromone receptor n=1 Tax=Rossellomorea marisflavi TaxID=189381 RepID=UPI003D2F2C06